MLVHKLHVHELVLGWVPVVTVVQSQLSKSALGDGSLPIRPRVDGFRSIISARVFARNLEGAIKALSVANLNHTLSVVESCSSRRSLLAILLADIVLKDCGDGVVITRMPSEVRRVGNGNFGRKEIFCTIVHNPIAIIIDPVARGLLAVISAVVVALTLATVELLPDEVVQDIPRVAEKRAVRVVVIETDRLQHAFVKHDDQVQRVAGHARSKSHSGEGRQVVRKPLAGKVQNATRDAGHLQLEGQEGDAVKVPTAIAPLGQEEANPPRQVLVREGVAADQTREGPPRLGSDFAEEVR
mmetsp:Transcript_27040/g.75541  ORF Transcript_27040/g.75541 Transcript_27040/m.75541 type:complete len:298 (+) Transcript_27040:899-1792(+)